MQTRLQIVNDGIQKAYLQAELSVISGNRNIQIQALVKYRKAERILIKLLRKNLEYSSGIPVNTINKLLKQ